MQSTSRIDGIYKEKLFSSLPLARFTNYLRVQIEAQKQHIFLWTPVIFALGIALYFLLPYEPPIILGLFALTLSLIGYSFTGKGSKLSLFALTALIFIAGFNAAVFRTYSASTPIIAKKQSAVSLEGNIQFIEKMEDGAGDRAILSNLEIEDFDKDATPTKIRLHIRKNDNIEIGQRIKVLAALNPPSGPLIPGGFDFRRYLYFQKIGAVGFVYNEPEIISKTPPNMYYNIEALRHFIEEKVFAALSNDKAAVAAALIVGKKNALSDEDKQAVRDAGLAHMLAISGLHVGLFAGTLFFIIRFAMACIPALALRYSIKKRAAICALSGAVFYMLIAGSTVPTQRAVLMSAIVFLAIIIDRSPISLRLVAASALIILALRPDSLLSVSFQMSFAAVTCLIYFYDLTRQIWADLYTKSNWLKRFMMYFLGVCITTIIASLATAPFALHHFGQVSFLGSIANLIAVPLLAFVIMPFALLSLILMPFGGEGAPLYLMGFGIDGMLDISYWAASLPGAVVHTAMWPFSAFLLIILSSLFIILWKGTGKLVAIPFLIVGIFSAQSYVMPDILVSSSHKLLLLKNEKEELYTSTRRSERFVLKNWEKLYGMPAKSAQLLDYKGNNKNNSPEHNCGEEGCRFMLKSQNISFARLPYILGQECDWADILISQDPIPKGLKCDAGYIIDKFDTWEKGAHAIWITPNNVNIKTISESISNRPWSKYNKKKNYQ